MPTVLDGLNGNHLEGHVLVCVLNNLKRRRIIVFIATRQRDEWWGKNFECCRSFGDEVRGKIFAG